ncbi:MAG: molybdate ABC transporter substrate-binding protein, partial [Acidimicrobiales bacterium]
MKAQVFLAVMGLAIAMASCSNDDTTTVTVHAASSLEIALGEIAESFTAESGVAVELVFAGSASLASSIVEGAEADVFASANPTVMERVVAADLVAAAPLPFVRNQLALVVPNDDPAGLAANLDALDSAAVARCAPEVPCGRLAVEAIGLLGLTIDPVTEESNVSAVLAKVELGEVDAGFVYQSDLH